MLIRALDWLCGVDSCRQNEREKKAKEGCERAYIELNSAHRDLLESNARVTLATATASVTKAAVHAAVSQYKKKVESGEHEKVKDQVQARVKVNS